MRPTWFWIVPLSLSLLPAAHSQAPLPPGTILPISLDQPLDTRKVRSGQQIRGHIMQDIPGSPVRRRDHIVGHVISVTVSASGPAELALRFDTIEQHGKKIPLGASLRALASWSDVEEANIPEESMDRGITPETATTTQIGGEQVYRGGGPVASGIEAVGIPGPYGAIARPRPNRKLGCGGDADGSPPQAFWVFSTDACGVYGFPGLQIAHAGRSSPVGTILLKSDSGRIDLPSGTGLLLRTRQAQ
jgi:hypothetical protein